MHPLKKAGLLASGPAMMSLALILFRVGENIETNYLNWIIEDAGSAWSSGAIYFYQAAEWLMFAGFLLSLLSVFGIVSNEFLDWQLRR